MFVNLSIYKKMISAGYSAEEAMSLNGVTLLISIYRHQRKTYNHQHSRSPYRPLVIDLGTIAANTCPESKEQDYHEVIMYFDHILVFFCPDVCCNRCDQALEV
jgi:hypothetical protein